MHHVCWSIFESRLPGVQSSSDLMLGRNSISLLRDFGCVLYYLSHVGLAGRGNHKQRIFREVKTDEGQTGQETQGKGRFLVAVGLVFRKRKKHLHSVLPFLYFFFSLFFLETIIGSTSTSSMGEVSMSPTLLQFQPPFQMPFQAYRDSVLCSKMLPWNEHNCLGCCSSSRCTRTKTSQGTHTPGQ